MKFYETKIYKAIVNWKVITLMLILIVILFGVAFDHIGKYFDRGNLESVPSRATFYDDDVLNDSSREEVVDNDRTAFKVISEEEIKTYIRLTAKVYGVPEELALKIAEAESDFRNICNHQSCLLGEGIFQFEPITWEEQCEGEVDNIKDNIDCAIKLFSRDEYWRWNPSRHEWGLDN